MVVPADEFDDVVEELKFDFRLFKDKQACIFIDFHIHNIQMNVPPQQVA